MEGDELIKKIKGFLECYRDILSYRVGLKKNHIVIDFNKLVQYDYKLAMELLDNPEEVLRAFSLVIENEYEWRMNVRFKNVPSSCKKNISELRKDDLDKFIRIEGIIKSKTKVLPKITRCIFECPSCGNKNLILQLDEIFKEPKKCPSCGRQGKFLVLKKETIDCCSIVLEEPPDLKEDGTSLSSIMCLIEDDLTEFKLEKNLVQGRRVEFTGILKSKQKVKRGKKLTLMENYLDVNYIKFFEEDYTTITISKKDESQIKQLAKKRKDILKYLSETIFRDIYGHEVVKEVLVLQMVGGVKKVLPNGLLLRGDIHVLLCGDPGSAKSTFLNIVNSIVPKSRYVSNLTTKVGLTAAVVYNDLINDWALEAGALPLAHKGMCLIDEIDKIRKEDMEGLNEAMERQTITVSKATIQSTLLAETSVLAAANPKYGRFDMFLDLFEQINFPLPLLNRFDFIFPIIDEPDEKKDRMIAKKILERNLDNNNFKKEKFELIKKYICYAKRLKPKFSPESLKYLEDAYIKIRTAPKREDKTISISPRQLEAIRRVAEACAKIRLSNKVELKDIKKAIDLVMYNLNQVAIDTKTGEIDIDKIETGMTTTKRDIIKKILNFLNKKGSLTFNELKILTNLDDFELEEILQKLKRSGDIFEPRCGLYSTT